MSFILRSRNSKDYTIALKHWIPVWDLLCRELKLDPITRYNGNIGDLVVNAKLCKNIRDALYNMVISGKIYNLSNRDACYICNGNKCSFCRESGVVPRRSLRKVVVFDVHTFCNKNIDFIITRDFKKLNKT